jgi:hypothetical protein
MPVDVNDTTWHQCHVRCRIVTDSSSNTQKVEFFLIDNKGRKKVVAKATLIEDGQIDQCTACFAVPAHAPLPECTQIAAVGRWMDQFLAHTPGISGPTVAAGMHADDDEVHYHPLESLYYHSLMHATFFLAEP